MAINPRTDGLGIIYEPYSRCPMAQGTFMRDRFAMRLIAELAPDNRDRIRVLEEIRELYWTTDNTSTEIRDAYLPGNPVCHVPKLAGPVKLNKDCGACAAELFTTSHSELNSRRWLRCQECIQTHRDTPEMVQFYAKLRYDHPEVYQLPQRPPSPDRGLSYQDYLQSDHWKATRSGALKRSGFSCQVCSAKGELHVHHRTYARRGCELDSDLIVLCAGCHQIFHDNGKLAEGGRAQG